MIFPSNRVRIMVATKPVDFRKGHDGLAALVKNELHKDPFTGTVFVFRSRKADRLKLIYWDGSGIVGLQEAGRALVHLARHQGRSDDADPRPV
ncbi:transposase [Rhizobium mongolense]|uniref:Transposase n=1 Tax=Rhizobium mongolense TaxID=57676 RepID=A0A7W6WGU8_9HYPH|nr:transposase [Rhizobium mongolense]